MNFSLDDRHRSLRRFLMNALGAPPWVIRTERVAVADEDRPVALIEAAGPTGPGRPARVSVPQGNVERVQTFALVLYPAMVDEDGNLLTAPGARQAAAAAAQLLEDAISVGLVDDAGGLVTAPERIPVYDFGDVPVVGLDRGGPADHYGWMWVEDFPVRAVQDPDDELRWTVTCPLRVSWEQMGRDIAPAPVVGAWQPSFDPTP